MAAPNKHPEVSFHEFATLISTIGQAAKQSSKLQPKNIFEQFVGRIRRQGPLTSETGARIFRLLFPDKDDGRKYGLQEAALSRHLVRYLKGLGISEAQASSVREWAGQSNNGRRGRLGCLGEEMRRVLSSYNLRSPTYQSSLKEIDALLDELARLCRFSQLPSPGFDSPARSQFVILADLYNSITPDEAAILTQLILKDLRPLLHPIDVVHTTRNLLKQKSPANQLTISEAMKIWDPRLSRVYRVCSSITEAFRVIESGVPPTIEPILGVPVQIPKCYKGRSCKDALKLLKASKIVYCETKYDGERMQIHIDLNQSSPIKIISKSQRDSTLDRHATHEIIRAALGIPTVSYEQPFLSRRIKDDEDFEQTFKKSIILEAEMVAFSERTHNMDEFWRIRGLIAETAKGVRRRPARILKARSSSPDTLYRDSDESSYESSEESPEGYSLESNGSDDGFRHFMVVFFDVLHVDGRNLLREPYSVRRAILRDVVREIEGFSRLAARTPIDMSRPDTERILQAILATSTSQFEEGLVLKADNSLYNSSNLPWVKLKKDYIPGLGDCVDMAVVGAAWDKERARELGVGTDTFTTFYVAALPDDMRSPPTSLICLYTVSYGLSREELERLNFEIKACSPVVWKNRAFLPYTVTLCPGIETPSVLFRTPLLFELFGAGFDKPPRSKYYVLRWPRVSKIHRMEERAWTAGETLASFTAAAYRAVGRDSTKKQIGIQVAAMWQASPEDSPEARSIVKIKAIEMNLLKKLRGGEEDPKKRPDRFGNVGAQRSATFGSASVRRMVPVEQFPTAVPDALGLLDEDVDGYPSDSSRSPHKRKRSLDNSVSSSDKRRRLEVMPREIHNESLGRVVALDVEADENSKPDPPAPPSARIVASPLLPTTARRLTLPSLMEDAFSVVIRPLYPTPMRPKGRPALETIFPTTSLVSTLDALLLGVEWTPRSFPFWKPIKRGLVFVDDEDKMEIIARLQKRKREFVRRGKSATEILVISRTYLDIYIDSGLQETVVEPWWVSHPYLHRARTTA